MLHDERRMTNLLGFMCQFKGHLTKEHDCVQDWGRRAIIYRKNLHPSISNKVCFLFVKSLSQTSKWSLKFGSSVLVRLALLRFQLIGWHLRYPKVYALSSLICTFQLYSGKVSLLRLLHRWGFFIYILFVEKVGSTCYCQSFLKYGWAMFMWLWTCHYPSTWMGVMDLQCSDNGPWYTSGEQLIVICCKLL